VRGFVIIISRAGMQFIFFISLFAVCVQTIFALEGDGGVLPGGVHKLVLEPSQSDALYGHVDRIYLDGIWKFKPEVNFLTTKGNRVVEKKEPVEMLMKDDQGEALGYYKVDFDDSSWSEMPVPLPWNVELGSKKFNKIAFAGIGYYRRSFFIPADKKGKAALLNFASIQTSCKVWVNGRLVEEYTNPQTSCGHWWHADNRIWTEKLTVDIAPFLQYGKDNQIAIRVVDDGQPIDYGFRPDDGGIVGPVRLDFKAPLYFSRMFVSADPFTGTVKVEATVSNPKDKPVTEDLLAELVPFDSKWYSPSVLSKSYKCALGKKTFAPGQSVQSFEFMVDNPVKWDMVNPFLYMLKIKSGRGVLGQARLGFRTMTVKGNRFMLNGHPIYLRGVEANLPVTGDTRLRAFNQSNWLRESLKIYRDANFNMIRVNGGPLPDAFYDICDEVGLMIQEDYTPKTTDLDHSVSKAEMIRRIELDEITSSEGLTPSGVTKIKKWLDILHNHPSVCMMTAGNELAYGSYEAGKMEQLATYINAFYDLVRTSDLQKRPITASSGLGVWSWAIPVKTDYYDFHNYCNGYLGWADCGSENMARYNDFKRIYKKIEKPVINGECGGYFSDILFPDIKKLNKNGKLDQDAYVQWANRINCLTDRPSYQEFIIRSYQIAFTGIRGAFSTQNIMDTTAKLNASFIEVMRRDMDFLEGFAIFNVHAGLMGLTPLYQETTEEIAQSADIARNNIQFTKLRSSLDPLTLIPDIYDRHVYRGDVFLSKVFLFNDQYARAEPSLIGRLELCNNKNEVKESTELEFNNIPERGRDVRTVMMPLPQELPEGDYSLRVSLLRNGSVVHSEEYPLMVAQKKIEPLTGISGKVGVFQNTGEKEAILDHFNIPYNVVTSPDQLSEIDILIIPAGQMRPEMVAEGNTIRQWVEHGGKLLCMEQSFQGPIPFASELTIRPTGSMFYADPIDLSHPLLSGLRPWHFEFWNGERKRVNGYLSAEGKSVYSHHIVPVPEGTVISGASKSGWLQNPRFGMVSGEVKIGKGLVFFSQALASSRLGTDPVAEEYLSNLFTYVLSQDWVKREVPKLRGKSVVRVDPKRCFYVDISGKANRTFTDAEDNDGKGGWFDQGANDIRGIPHGKLTCNGVPYQILDDAGDKPSCMIVCGKARPDFPMKIAGIPVNKKAKRLFFLHCCAWGKDNEKAGEYRVNYANGKVETVPLVVAQTIGDWWSNKDYPGARVWCTVAQANGNIVNLYTMTWDNPHSDWEIKSIDIVSAGKAAVPACVAISGEN